MPVAPLPTIPLFSLLPFVVMLGAIAIMPLAAPYFWEHNRNKLIVALCVAVPIAGYLLFTGFTDALVHTLIFDYVPFIILMGALFVITGGIFMDGDIEATPLVNTGFLALGAVLASFMGTTGAAMLLIRPLLHTNKERTRKQHTALFFIGIVANCGGLLTPLGDPPLFMLYLRGAPFGWFVQLFPLWLFVNGVLLVLYFALDTYHHRLEPASALASDKRNIEPIRLDGLLNLVWLAGVVLAVAFINAHYIPAVHDHHWLSFVREAVILACAWASLISTKHITRVSNSFTWHPIQEVAALFLGIFVTMVPCILYLQEHAHSLGERGLANAIPLYYATGILSAILDNAPTALTFHSLAVGLNIQNVPLVAGAPEGLLKAIAVAAVFFGSLTYIGNGPNLMVKAIAENNNVPMPHFFGYIGRFSLLVLLPVFIAAQLLFIR
jgi:Na+/H+ antiporter NhaD/arsenite permease-like protein